MILPEVRNLLNNLTPDLDAMASPWIVIGSGALMLLGAPVEAAADLDIVTEPAAARRLRAVWKDWLHGGEAKAPDGPFQSEDFARYETPWGPVEVMGGLHVGGAPLVIAERHPDLPIPSAEEQLRILRLFGRPKDLERAECLSRWLSRG